MRCLRTRNTGLIPNHTKVFEKVTNKGHRRTIPEVPRAATNPSPLPSKKPLFKLLLVTQNEICTAINAVSEK